MKQKRGEGSKVLLLLPILIAAFSSVSDAREPAALCEELDKLEKGTPLGRARYALDGIKETRPAHAGKQYIPNVDIDGDDLSDELLWSCPGAGSIIRTDPCDISIKLSSLKKTIRLEAWGLFLFRYHSQIFVAAAADEKQDKTNIYRVNRSGFELVCEKL